MLNKLIQCTNNNWISHQKFTLPCFNITCFTHAMQFWPISAFDRKQVSGYEGYQSTMTVSPWWLTNVNLMVYRCTKRYYTIKSIYWSALSLVSLNTLFRVIYLFTDCVWAICYRQITRKQWHSFWYRLDMNPTRKFLLFHFNWWICSYFNGAVVV